MPDDHKSDQEGQNVRSGDGVQQTVKSEENRQDDGESHAQNDLAGHGNDGGEERFSQSLKVDKGALVDHGQDHHAQVDAEALDGKARIIGALVAGAEDADELSGEKLNNKRGYNADDSLCGQQIAEKGLCPVLASGADIVAHHRDAAGGKAHGDGESHYRLREDYGVRRVAVRTQIVGVGNKDLVYNIIKRRHNKRNNAGNGIFPHQFTDFFRFQESV